MYQSFIPPSPHTSDSSAPPSAPIGGSLFGAAAAEARFKTLLSQLNAHDLELRNRPVQALRDEITSYAGLDSLPNAYVSSSVAGSNQDCVIAAFRTAKGRQLDENSISGFNTSTDEGIAVVARIYGMSRIRRDELRRLLPELSPNEPPKADARRAFIQAPAVSGMSGRYHAYAAIGIHSRTGKIIAWDTDSVEQEARGAKFKLVPFSLVELAYA